TSDLQKGSNQVFSRSLHERDLEIGRLRRESEKLKKDQLFSSGLMSSMQRELLQKEQKIQQLQQETEKLNKENREKDNQLAVFSAKEPYPPLFFIHFCQVIKKVRQISDENQQSREREKSLQKELSSRLAKEKEVSADIEVFKNSLQQLQACLRSPCSSTSLRGELGQLEELSLDPSVSAIRTAVVDMAHGPLAWLEGAEQLLDSAGVDLHTSVPSKPVWHLDWGCAVAEIPESTGNVS
uniref:Uncharacterized protein n=1 Tax=Zosterops lateralis melanops TaxID=1220523 RepID=A0A8D2QP99_ZOSLA